MMRSLPSLLLLVVFGICCWVVFGSAVGADPREEAQKFLAAVAAGDVRTAEAQFGDNTCHCAPKGGYIAYLRYDLANEPTLAFLLGQKFTTGQMQVEQLPFNGEKYVLPWDKPEDVAVYVPLTFEDPNRRPYFVPMDMAFGFETPEGVLKSFCADGGKNMATAFTLRLRPRLTPDVVERTPPPKQADEEKHKKIEEGLLPPEMMKYQNPKDAGPVRVADGSLVSADKFATAMPRLKSIVVGLKIVRNGVLHRWRVKRIVIRDATVLCGDKEIMLGERPAPND